MDFQFHSHRSMLTCTHGCAASSQPLASQIGIDILKDGGNAADAAVAMAAALNLTEPCSTGLGGDAFCLFYDSKEQKVKGMNASGRSPSKLTLDVMQETGFNKETGFPLLHGLAVTVPGAAAGWVDCVENFGSGKLSLKELFTPTINLARNGFPVAGPWTVDCWKRGSPPLFDPRNIHGKNLLIACESKIENTEYRTPKAGEIFRNPDLADVIECLGQNGKKGFYEGWVAEAVVAAVKKFGGVMELIDLQNHFTTFDEPISIQYKDVRLWEMPPNGQGIVALEALNILKNFSLKDMEPGSPEYLHLVIEALKLGFMDAMVYCSDPAYSTLPVKGLLSKEYGEMRSKLINQDHVIKGKVPGNPVDFQGDTVYFTVIDKDRNACSFINSNYMKFGTGIVPSGCGFSLQNRGANFSLVPGHANVVAPNKRSYQTIIPAMLTDADSTKLLMSYGVMGSFMQPQGHVQVLLNLVEFGMNPQQALDQPRIRVSPGPGLVQYEEGIPEDTIQILRAKGHNLEGPIVGQDRNFLFGNGQVIAVRPFWDKEREAESNVLWAGSDPRCDGAAVGY